ncbi:unnamed protein product [Closterium sp. Naga37s-1]|nr:unnamed protein product [Closterium sp. Naga37s-1]
MAFNVIFTFSLSPKGKAASNGFAFVVSASNTVGSSVGVGYGGMDDRSMAIEFDVLQNKPHGDMKEEHMGLNIQGQDKSIAAVKSPFKLTNKQAYTAWVDYTPGDPGTIQVFLANTAEKPGKPLLKKRLSLCEVLKPGPPQPLPALPRTIYFGFVVSTTVKPFTMQAILSSELHTGRWKAGGFPGGSRRSVFPLVSFLSCSYSSCMEDDACWAFAVVSSIEAAYGIATNQEVPRMSVDSLFASMGLTTQAAKCTASGSPTEAFEKLLALPKGGITMEGNLVCYEQ